MAYRGGTRLWSNRYHFLGGTPADTSHWNTLFDAVTAAEKAIHTSRNTITEAIGYAAGSDVPVASKTYSLAGTNTGGSTLLQMGEVAALCRWSTDVRTGKNHPIYLFSYWHGVYGGGTTGDVLDTTTKTAMTTYATSWVTGFSDGTNTYNRAGPNGAAGLSPVVQSNLTVHTFPR